VLRAEYLKPPSIIQINRCL